MKKSVGSGWPEDQGPVYDLRRVGRLGPRERVVWARGASTSSVRGGAGEMYEAAPAYLTPSAILDLAWLATEGWDVFLRAGGDAILVRISPRPPKPTEEHLQ